MAVKNNTTENTTENKTETKTETKTVRTNKPKKTPAKENYCVYIGPTIEGVIQSGAVYGKSLKDTKAYLEIVIKKYPLIEKLIVTDRTIAKDRIKVSTPGNLLYEYYKRLAGTIKK